MSLKLGKLAATRPFDLSDLSVYAAGKLPYPPAEAHNDPHGAVALPMDGNDQYGDCVMAACAHAVAIANHAVNRTDPVPSEQQVVDEYFTLTGGQDSGLNESDTLSTWYKQGLFGSKIAGYAPVPTSSITQIHQSVAFYAGCFLGVQLPQSAQDQFGAGEPWTVVPDSPILGGHAIYTTGYDPGGLWCSTWGGLVYVTYPWIQTYLDEAWCILFHQFVEAHRGPTLDLATLQADLAQV